MSPVCGYKLEGLSGIKLLDYDDFGSFGFGGGGLYDNCLVTGMIHTGDIVEVEAPETANYSSTLQDGIYTHTLESFINELSSELSAQLHLASNRRYLAFFKTNAGRQFVFGYEAGATLSYANQTADGTGALITISAASKYPLFEFVQSEASCTWFDFINIWEYRDPDLACEWGNFINIWERACINDYSDDYSRDYNCTAPEWQPYLDVSPASLIIEPEPPNEIESQVRSNNDWIIK